MNWTLSMLVLVPVFISVGQLLFKVASQTTNLLSVGWTEGITSLLTNPWFLAAVMLYGVATVAWIFVLQDVPVSRAYQFMSLSFVVVPIGAWLAFGEVVNVRQALGMAIIVGGIIVGNS